MALTLQRKRALLWGLGIVVVMVLIDLAWAQIVNGLSQCFCRY